MNLDPKNLLVDRAYQLWQASESQETVQDRQKKIVTQLFTETKQKNPWFGWFYSFVETLFPHWMEKKVNLALSAYKYDLIISRKEDSHKNLFSKTERWFIDQNLIGVLKNILTKHGKIGLKGKAHRWEEKVKKYYSKREFMIGSYILYQITEKFPNFKNSINWMKALNMPYIERQSKQTLCNVNDDAIVQGVVQYLGRPFDEKKTLTRIFTEISYYVAKEKTKAAAKGFSACVSNGAYSVYRAIRNNIPFLRPIPA